MIHMRMGQEHIINHSLLHRQFRIFKGIYPLFHPPVNQNMLSGRLQIMAAARYLMIRSDKN